MLIGGSAGDEEVIHVRMAKTETTENHIHEPLKGLCRVPEAEGHAHELEEAERGGECSLVDISRLHGDLMVGTYQVQLGEHGGTPKRGGGILDVRNGVAVRDSYAVQCTVVAARAPISGGLLRYHVQWRRPGAGRRANDPELQHVLELLLGHTKTFRS